jgi:hypothetical protein
MLNQAYKAPTLEEIRQERKKRLVAVVLIAYADESMDGSGNEVFAIAGIMGTQEEWDNLELDWRKRTNGRKFHATDCLAGHGDYEGIPKNDRVKEYRDLTKILCKSSLMGYGCALDIIAYKNCLLRTTRNMPYLHCFVDVITSLAFGTSVYVPQHQKIRFVFDRRKGIEITAGELMGYYQTLTEYKQSAFLGGVTFSSIDEVGIQAADLVVHEYMLEMYYHIHSEKPHARRSLRPIQLLIDSHRFDFTSYGKVYFETKFKESLKACEEESGLSRKSYLEWLAKYNRHDNDGNKVRYLIYMNSINNRNSTS